MRVLHRIADLDQKADARADVEPALVAPAIDRIAFDKLHREIRRIVFGDAAVVQRRDVRMREPRERVALAQEPPQQLGTAELAADQLQRHLRDELSIGTFGEEHATHAARADFAQQTIRSDARAGARSVRGFARALGK